MAEALFPASKRSILNSVRHGLGAPEIDSAERCVEIVSRRTRGESLKSIAIALGISPKTVEFHWAKARRRIGLWDVAEVTRWAVLHQL